MPPFSDVLTILGPLAEIMPRVVFVMMAAAAAVMAAAHVGRAVRAHQPLRLLIAWLVLCASGGAAAIGIESLMAYGGPASHDAATFIEPLSLAGARLLFGRHAAVCIAAVVAGPVLAALLRRARHRFDASAERVLLEQRRS